MKMKNDLKMKNVVEMNSRCGKSIMLVYRLLLLKKQLKAKCKVSLKQEKHWLYDKSWWTIEVKYYKHHESDIIKTVAVYSASEKQAKRFKRLLELKGDLV